MSELTVRSVTVSEPSVPEPKKRGIRFFRSKSAVLGAAILLVLVAVGVFAPLIAPYHYDLQNFEVALTPPFTNPNYILGTDQFGRDILSRIIYGSRITLLIAVTGMIIATVLGVTVGIISGYEGGVVDAIVMRVADVQLSFPYLILAIAMMALLGPSLPLLILVLVVRGWVSYARTIRAVVLSLREAEFVMAAIAMGATKWRVILRHLLPNSLAPIIVLSSFELAAMMLIEASLSFLGLGVQPPMPSWGSMISQGRDYIYSAWWLTTMPGFVLMFAVLGANQFGDGLRDLLDPRLRNDNF